MTTPITEIMSRSPIAASPDMRVDEAREILDARRVHYLLLVRGHELVGVTCRCGLRRSHGAAVIGTTARAPVWIAADASVEDAAARMRAGRVGCLPVVNAGLVLGVVTRRDLRRIGIGGDAVGESCAACGTYRELVQGDAVSFCEECVSRGKEPCDLGGDG